MGHLVPILLYHRIDHSNSFLATKPSEFRKHLRYLAERGWRSMTLKEFEACCQDGGKFPERRFVLSFDDGYDSVAHTAAPIMEEFEFSGVAFVCTKFMAGGSSDDTGQRDQDSQGFLTWDQARALQAAGTMEFQSHTHTHREFAACTPTEIADDLLASVNLLSKELRLPQHYFRHLAWPWGNSTQAWRSIADHIGFEFQYTVARASFLKTGLLQQIPRVCFDAKSAEAFQRQFWLQTGPLATPWHAAYGMARSAKHMIKAMHTRSGTEKLAPVKAKMKNEGAPLPPSQ